jgi:Family of unknown function (DUF5317)
VLFYGLAIVAAILIVPLTGGRFRQLGRIQLRRPWMLFAGLAIQIVLEYVDLPRARYDDLGLALLLLSYVFIIGFGLSNLLLAGMGVITVGVALNGFVIALNQGMPYKVPDGETAEVTVKHRPQKPDDVLPALGDSIAIGSPVDAAFSFGDIIIAVGLVDLTYRASRRPRRSRRRPHDTDDELDLEAMDAPAAAPSDGSDADGQRVAGGRDALEGVEHSRVVDVAGT